MSAPQSLRRSLRVLRRLLPQKRDLEEAESEPPGNQPDITRRAKPYADGHLALAVEALRIC